VIVSSASPYGSGDAEAAVSAHLVRLASGTPHPRVPLTKLITLGGKSPQADLKLRGLFVGDVAFSISKTPRGFVISHAGGRRRTRVNGEVVERQRELLEGDIITIGPTTFRFSRQGTLGGQRQRAGPAWQPPHVLSRCHGDEDSWVYHRETNRPRRDGDGLLCYPGVPRTSRGPQGYEPIIR